MNFKYYNIICKESWGKNIFPVSWFYSICCCCMRPDMCCMQMQRALCEWHELAEMIFVCCTAIHSFSLGHHKLKRRPRRRFLLRTLRVRWNIFILLLISFGFPLRLVVSTSATLSSSSPICTRIAPAILRSSNKLNIAIFELDHVPCWIYDYLPCGKHNCAQTQLRGWRARGGPTERERLWRGQRRECGRRKRVEAAARWYGPGWVADRSVEK